MDECICIYDDEIVGQGGDDEEALMAALDAGRIDYRNIADGDVHVYHSHGKARFRVEVG